MSDLISRAEAIKAIEDLQDCYNGFSDTFDKACIIGVLEEMPSADRPTGKWIKLKAHPESSFRRYQCSVCMSDRLSHDITNYCPNCGADMRGEDE